jgi:hypothetical protein
MYADLNMTTRQNKYMQISKWQQMNINLLRGAHKGSIRLVATAKIETNTDFADTITSDYPRDLPFIRN